MQCFRVHHTSIHWNTHHIKAESTAQNCGSSFACVATRMTNNKPYKLKGDAATKCTAGLMAQAPGLLWASVCFLCVCVVCLVVCVYGCINTLLVRMRAKPKFAMRRLDALTRITHITNPVGHHYHLDFREKYDLLSSIISVSALKYVLITVKKKTDKLWSILFAASWNECHCITYFSHLLICDLKRVKDWGK